MSTYRELEKRKNNILHLQSKCILSIMVGENSRYGRSDIMANKENMTLRIEADLKKQAAALFKALGMDLSTATGIFYRQALRYQGLPFEVRWLRQKKVRICMVRLIAWRI